MQASPKPIERMLDPYRMRQRPLTVDEIAELAAHLHIAHLTELQRLRDFQRRFEWPHSQEHVFVKPRKQIIRMNSRLDQGVVPPTLVTWRPVVLPRNLKELFDSVPKQENVNNNESVNMWRASRSCAVGALLLLAALFLVRATDRFFTRNYLRWRRSRSQEWPTPNVLATSNRSTFVDTELPQELDTIPSESSSSQEIFSSDLPPPYSECRDPDDPNKHKYEEPPPPYSACYVEFNNPKDGLPSVHFYNSQRRNIFEDLDAASTSHQRDSVQNEPQTQDKSDSNSDERLEVASTSHQNTEHQTDVC